MTNHKQPLLTIGHKYIRCSFSSFNNVRIRHHAGGTRSDARCPIWTEFSWCAQAGKCDLSPWSWSSRVQFWYSHEAWPVATGIGGLIFQNPLPMSVDCLEPLVFDVSISPVATLKLVYWRSFHLAICCPFFGALKSCGEGQGDGSQVRTFGSAKPRNFGLLCCWS